jgi:hypothetical protein
LGNETPIWGAISIDHADWKETVPKGGPEKSAPVAARNGWKLLQLFG